LHFASPLWPWEVAFPDPQGPSSGCPLSIGRQIENTPLILDAIFPDSFKSEPFSLAEKTAFLEVIQRAPLDRSPRMSPLPKARLPRFFRQKALQFLLLVPLLRFCTFSAAYASPILPVYFTRFPIMGFSTFHSAAKQNSPHHIPPFKAFHLSAATSLNVSIQSVAVFVTRSLLAKIPVHRKPSPLTLFPFKSCCQDQKSRNFRGLLRDQLRCVDSRCRKPIPAAFLGLINSSPVESFAQFFFSRLMERQDPTCIGSFGSTIRLSGVS
jgi:hypothetical protein